MTSHKYLRLPQLFKEIFAAFCLLLADSCILLFFDSLASKSAKKLIITKLRLQTESKGNFCLITVYGHKTFRQPQNIRAKKQTFSNLAYASPFLCYAA
jgi:hypothetical protein